MYVYVQCGYVYGVCEREYTYTSLLCTCSLKNSHFSVHPDLTDNSRQTIGLSKRQLHTVFQFKWLADLLLHVYTHTFWSFSLFMLTHSLLPQLPAYLTFQCPSFPPEKEKQYPNSATSSLHTLTYYHHLHLFHLQWLLCWQVLWVPRREERWFSRFSVKFRSRLVEKTIRSFHRTWKNKLVVFPKVYIILRECVCFGGYASYWMHVWVRADDDDVRRWWWTTDSHIYTKVCKSHNQTCTHLHTKRYSTSFAQASTGSRSISPILLPW